MLHAIKNISNSSTRHKKEVTGTMKLHVQVLEARGLAAMDSDGSSDPYVKLQLGKSKARTAVISKCLNPSWREDFYFTIDDLKSELLITVWDKDCFTDDFLGQVKVPVSEILNAENQTLLPAWYALQKRSSKSKSTITGEIHISMSLYGRAFAPSQGEASSAPSNSSTEKKTSPNNKDSRLPALVRTNSVDSDLSTDTPTPRSSNATAASTSSPEPKNSAEKSKTHLRQKISVLFNKKTKPAPMDTTPAPMETTPNVLISEDSESCGDEEESVLLSFFDENGEHFGVSDEPFPPPLSGGILLDQSYVASMKHLNAILFKPDGQFLKDLAAVQQTTDLVEEAWKKIGNEPPKRVVTYMKAATRLVKSVKATEEQTYTRADEKGYVICVDVNTPDVPCGSCFRCELQYCITPEADTPGGEKCSHLRISWRLNFTQNTWMRTMIESGAKQGLRDSYQQYAEVLSKYVRPLSDADYAYDEAENKFICEKPKSDLELAKEYFWNPTVIITIILLLFMLLHIYLARFTEVGLEFWFLDLPDSFSELIISAVLVLSVEHIVKVAFQLLKTRLLTVSDHGVKAQGEGWLLTVTLIEGENLAIPENAAFSDPYVVFTCNGRTRTSSIKLKTTNPQWNEIFEFDATEDAPSTMDLEVYDFDGPFSEGESLGYAEINFLKYKAEEMSELWVPLSGKRALACGSRLRLRVFLTNTKQSDIFVEYVQRVEKEVGTKIVKRSAQRNHSFQKLFSLPSEEFLINDFACAIKKKILLQGRLFLSPRMLGFYSNIFGHKTKFSLLWEDIEEITETVPPLGYVATTILVFTRKGRGFDAQQGAKSMDSRGRLKFQFQSFVRPGYAFRTITVIWRSRTLSPEQQLEMVQDVEEDEKYGGAEQTDDNAVFIGFEEPNMKEVFSTSLPLTVDCMLTIYEKGMLEEKIMEKAGCLDYTRSPWEAVEHKPSVQQRQVSFKYNRRLCQFGSAVTCLQQKDVSADKKVAIIDENMTLHDVPFGDHFQLQVRRELREMSTKPPSIDCKVYVGIAWQKGTALQTQITTNIFEHYTAYLKEVLQFAVKEILTYKDTHAYVLV